MGHPACWRDLESSVTAVAKWGNGAVLAAAEVDGFGLCGLKLDRCKVGDLVAAVAERLVGAEAAGTPVVAFTGFDGDGIRAFLSYGWSGHGEFSLGASKMIIAQPGRKSTLANPDGTLAAVCRLAHRLSSYECKSDG